MLRFAVLSALVTLFVTPAMAQVVCGPNGCLPVEGIHIHTLNQADSQGLTSSVSPAEAGAGGDAFEQVIRATVRVTVSGVCGSGTIVGKDANGRSLILTNAHVAGTTKGRVVNVERWELNGRSQRSTASIVASGYGRGMSIDFAILRAAEGFGTDVKPVPIANRQPDTSALITTYGCPRCEWPSLQVLKLNRSEGQILTWHPEAIGGRSGSSVIDYTSNGPEVVGLLTWGGGGEGLGQSMPFVLNALQGRLPKSLEPLPPHAREVSCLDADATDSAETLYRAAWPTQDIEQGDEDLVDAITGGRLRPNKPEPQQPDGDTGLLRPNKPDRPVISFFGSLLRNLVVLAVGFAAGGIAGYVFRGQLSKWFS